MTFADKVKRVRYLLEINQEELARRVGVSRRSINSYENEGIIPRDKIMRQLAHALDVSVAYLTNDAITDADYGKVREAQIDSARQRFGPLAAKEAEHLLAQNAAFFAGGELPQEDKDAFFEAIISAYLSCKETARIKFNPMHQLEA